MAALEFVVLLACALLVSGALAHQLKVAAPVLQLAAGVLLGFAPALRETALPPEVLLLVFLPVLLYWRPFPRYAGTRHTTPVVTPVLTMLTHPRGPRAGGQVVLHDDGAR